MNTKQYVDKFEEIKNLEVSKQKEILEQARYEAFTKLGLSGRSSFYLVACLLLALAIGTVPPYIISFSIITNSIFTGIGVFSSLLVLNWLNRQLLHKGIKSVLSKPNA